MDGGAFCERGVRSIRTLLGCPVNTHLFSGIEDVEQLMEIIKQAAREGAMLIYTLAYENMAASARHACKRWGRPIHRHPQPNHRSNCFTPRRLPFRAATWSSGQEIPSDRRLLQENRRNRVHYKARRRSFTPKLTQSRHCSRWRFTNRKTPLSIYLAQKGVKVANVPIGMGVALPITLFEVDQEKIFALTINPVVLQTIRRARAKFRTESHLACNRLVINPSFL